MKKMIRAKKVSAYLMATVVCAAMLCGAGTAQAALQALGAVNPATGFPFWYQDTNGLALSLCLDQNGFCVIDPLQNPLPTDRTGINSENFPVESFYYSADTSGTNASGIQLELYEAAVEAGFVSEPIVDGGQAVFTRIRIRASVPVAGTYVVTHPYGVNTFANVPTGTRGINFTADVPGLVILPFDQNHPSLAGSQVQPQAVGPFLTRADGTIVTDPGTGNKYIGLPGAAVAVTGSPTGNNFVRISGPAGTLQINTFNLMGKVVGLEVTPQTGANFGFRKLNTPSAPLTFTVTNRTGVNIPARNPNADPPEPGLVLTPTAGFSIVADDSCADGLAAVPTGSAPDIHTCTFGVVFTPVADGVVTGTVSIASTASPLVTIPVTGTGDGSAPTVTFGAGQQKQFTNAATATISGTVADNSGGAGVASLQASVNGGPVQTVNTSGPTWSFNVANLTLNAENSISVTATDLAQTGGNASAAQTATITHDDTLPAVTLTSPPAGLTTNKTPTLTFTASDANLASTTVKVDGAIVQKVSGEALDALSDGSHTITVEAADSAGNTRNASSTISVDATGPVFSVSSPAATTGKSAPPLIFTVTEAHPSASDQTVIKLDGNVVAKTSGDTLGPFTPATQGLHTLQIDSVDALGNTSSRQVAFTVILSDGDIDMNGSVSIADALLALRASVNLVTLTPGSDPFYHGDVTPLDVNGKPNPNGSVDITDALVILRKVVGLVTTF